MNFTESFVITSIFHREWVKDKPEEIYLEEFDPWTRPAFQVFKVIDAAMVIARFLMIVM